MIYTELTNKAMKIASEAHSVQQDAGAIPYIFHPYHLAEQMNNETRCCIALLHDVVEDTDVTIEELEKEFPSDIIEALKLLTHDINEDYYQYIKKICTNMDAAFVKMADLIHNMTEDRLLGADITDEEKNRWLVKYIRALKMVTDMLGEKIMVPACQDDFQWQIIWKQYPTINRVVTLEIECAIEKYLEPWQIDILNGKPVSEQIIYFEIEIIREKKGVVLDEYCNVETEKAAQFLEDYSNKMILLSHGCVVGILHINTQYGWEYCRKMIEPIYVNGYRVCRYCKSWVNHSIDHLAVVHETVSYRMKWKG